MNNMILENKKHFLLYFDDTTDADQVYFDDCFACPQTFVRPLPPLQTETSIKTHPEWQYIPLTPDYYVAFVPSFSRVAVVNIPYALS